MSAMHEPSFERSDVAAERLAAGFAEHVVRWARQLKASVVIPGPNVVPGDGFIARADVVILGLTRDPRSPETASTKRHGLRVRPAMTSDTAPTPEAASPQPDPDSLEILRHCAYATSLATSNGHVCITLEELASLPPSLSEAGQASLSPSPPGGGQGWGQFLTASTLRTTLRQSGVVGTPDHPGSLPLILDEDGRLYLHRYFDYEVRLARRLMQAAQSPPRPVSAAARELLNQLFSPTLDNEVDWQKIAAAMALRNTLTIISGGPGTGKTTTVVNLLACLLIQEPNLRIALAAPTGKAAARMTEAIRQRADNLPEHLRAKLPQESFTIHRLLGANPGEGRFTYGAANPLPYDAVIVDEASMLDLALATRLLEAAPASARIIQLGDKDQLAAVEAGAVFAEMSADPSLSEACRRDVAALCGYAPEAVVPPAPAQTTALHDCAVWLTRNYRFAAESAIGRLATDIKEGRAEEAIALLTGSRAEGRKDDAAAESSSPSTRSGRTPSKAKQDTASLALFPELEPAQGSKVVIAASSRSASTPVIAASRSLPRTPIPGNPDVSVPVTDPTRDTSVQWLDPSATNATTLNSILAAYTPYFDAIQRDPTDIDAITRAFSQFRVLCAVRQGPSGVTSINEHLTVHARLTLFTGSVPHSQDPRSPWYTGRPVMVLRNDYVLKLFNGDIGIALPDASGELAVYFPDGENGYRAVPTVRMPEHETAFAMTVHKAQGSECDAVLLLLPQQPSRVVTRELLYTAVTRARTRVMLSASVEVLKAAINCRLERHSGLPARQRESAGLS